MANADLDKQPDSVSSVLKVFGILQALGEEREIGITELSQRVMMSKSTVYRFLQTMKTLGYVAQEGESEKYSLTLKLFELGARALQNVDLIRSADIQMREISRLTKETIHLGALDEDSIVYIHKIDSMYNLRMYSRIGRRNAENCTRGKYRIRLFIQICVSHLSPHCECFIKIRTVFYYNFAPGWSQSIFCRLVTILRHPP